jgi:hypothetical protein
VIARLLYQARTFHQHIIIGSNSQSYYDVVLKMKHFCKSLFASLSSLVSSKENLVLVFFSCFNILVVTGVNVLYVLVENNYKDKTYDLSNGKRYKVLVPIAFGAFKPCGQVPMFTI